MSQRLTIAMIVLNEVEFIEYNLRQHYAVADEILILEGADRRYPNHLVTKDGMSKDGTTEMIENFPDPDNKIQYFQMGWTTKNDMAKLYIQYVRDGWLLRIDGDEFYSRQSLKNIKTHMKKTKHDCLIYPAFHLWKGCTHHMTGGFYSVPHMKLMRITPGCNFDLDHVRLCYRNGKQYLAGHTTASLWTPDIEMIHLGFARKNEERVATNLQYYKNVGETQTRPEYIRARSMWHKGDKIDQRYVLKEFKGELPEILRENKHEIFG